MEFQTTIIILLVIAIFLPIAFFMRRGGKYKDTSSNNKGDIHKTAIQNAPIAILITDKSGKIILQNEAAQEILQCDKKDDIKDEIFSFISSDNHDDLKNALHNSQNTKFNIELLLPDSPTISLQINPDDDGQYIIYLTDITEKNNLEQRFIQSQKMQAVGQLAGGIAHDFNNLLTAMIGFCDLLLLRHSPSDHSFADIMQIKQNANRAASLVSQLLAFSRKQTLQPKVIDVTEVLADIANLIRRLIGENIVCDIKHGRDIATVKVDQGQLEQVIINLCVNARDAMKETGQLYISTENIIVNDGDNKTIIKELSSTDSNIKISAGEYVVIKIRDTGFGMSKYVQKQIFEPFFTTKDVGEGTGLGLSTVYGIIEQTGGYVFVNSQKNVGTCFSILLKHHINEELENDNDIDNNQPNITPDLTGTETILLVEDEDSVRMFSARALTNKGYNVLEANCADSAFAVIAQNPDNINIIITDVMMPGMTGPAMVEKIRSDYPNYKDIKVIFMSGYGEDAFIESYGSQRSFSFIAKPFSLQDLSQKTKEILGGADK